jgi:alpha-beta hydrolase superfamily lysophospholipase
MKTRYLLLSALCLFSVSCSYYRTASKTVSKAASDYYKTAGSYADDYRTYEIEERYLFQPRLTQVRPETSDRRNIEVKLPDGNILRGLAITRPEPIANVIYFGGNAEFAQGATTKFMQWAELYNVNVICVDYRGFGASSGSPSVQYLTGDALRVYDGVSEMRSEIPTFVVGFSIGSIPATYLASHRRVQGLVLLAPISSLGDDDMYPLEQRRQMLPRSRVPLAKYVKVKLNFEVPDGIEPIHQIKQISAPLLLMHGKADDVVPALCGQKVFDLAGVKKTLLLLPVMGHDKLSLTDGSGAEYLAKFVNECLSSGVGGDSGE